MKLLNNTNWDSKSLRRIFTLCLREINKVERKKIEIVYVETHRSLGWVGGCAPLNGRHLTIKIPHPKWGTIVKTEIADTFIHEVGHTLGVNHTGKKRKIYTIEKPYHEWVEKTFGDELLPEKKKVEKTKPDIQIIRYERALKNLKKAQTRLKRAKTIFSNWDRKVKYYEVVVANKKK